MKRIIQQWVKNSGQRGVTAADDAMTPLSPLHRLLKQALKQVLKLIFLRVFRVTLHGFEHYAAAGDKVLIVANHTSYLDPVLLWTFLPDGITFAISTEITQAWWARPAPYFAGLFPMNPTQPLAIKGLTRYLKNNRKAVIFPEGRITVSGGLMKIYDGAALIALKSGASILPIRVDGPQYTPFSHLGGQVRRRFFPPIRLSMLPPQRLDGAAGLSPHEQRHRAGMALADLMGDMMFRTGHWQQSLYAAVLAARRIHGGGHLTLEDIRKKPLSYNRLLTESLLLGRTLAARTDNGAVVGLLLPNLCVTVSVLLGLQVEGRTPALLNPGSGLKPILSCCRTARIKNIVTSRALVEKAGLGAMLEVLAGSHTIIYLEDMRQTLGPLAIIRALGAAWLADYWYPRQAPPAHSPAVILFTSGSEGEPKGVVLSHANLLANLEQLAARVDFTPRDKVLNVLPVFHSFGLTAGTLLPLLNGMRVFLYPTPLHYRIIPEIAYDTQATLLFGTNTFLMGYGRQAHPYDFHSIRYVYAGAEKLQNDTRKLWMDKFGIRIMEGYGATETAPIVAANTAMYYREGSVGRPLPGMTCKLESVDGITEGGRLHVAGPNVMLGYLRPENPGVLQAPVSCFGEGFYDTGDIVSIDDEGYIKIQGRAKRFAKIGGEMVSLAVVEELATRLWPGYHHAALHLPDSKKGEKIVLMTDCPTAGRADYAQAVQHGGYSEIHIPRNIRRLKALPLLASGKVDYPGLMEGLRQDEEPQTVVGLFD